MAGLRGEVLLDVLHDGVMLLVVAEYTAVCSDFLFGCIGVQFALSSECAALVEVLYSNR